MRKHPEKTITQASEAGVPTGVSSTPQPQYRNQQLSQTHLFVQYQGLRAAGLPLPRFQDTGYRIYSQTDEDGLLLFIFSQIGFSNKLCLDIAFGVPGCSNTTNLIVNWGFHGVLIEGDSESIERSRHYFKAHPDTYIFPPKLVNAWVTAENINDLVRQNGLEGEIDLFSLDVDGIDYWLWKSLDVVKPRVVVVEFQDIWGERSVTVPYRQDFDRFKIHEDYFGASLPAFVKLAAEKGYRLIGANRYGYNAFFLRNDLGSGIFPEVGVQDCFYQPKFQAGVKERLPAVRELPWLEIE